MHTVTDNKSTARIQRIRNSYQQPDILRENSLWFVMPFRHKFFLVRDEDLTGLDLRIWHLFDGQVSEVVEALRDLVPHGSSEEDHMARQIVGLDSRRGLEVDLHLRVLGPHVAVQFDQR